MRRIISSIKFTVKEWLAKISSKIHRKRYLRNLYTLLELYWLTSDIDTQIDTRIPKFNKFRRLTKDERKEVLNSFRKCSAMDSKKLTHSEIEDIIECYIS